MATNGKEVKQSESTAMMMSSSGVSPVSSVTPMKDLQETYPTRPLKSSFPRQTLGDSGTRMLHGIITEEYNPQLQGIEGIKIFDQMRKSDGTVRAAMLVCTLPIRRAEWFVKPANDTPDAEEQASFVRRAIFDWNDLSWDDVLRQALLMCSFGVMLFEKVYGTYEHDGKTYVTLKKLAPRLPKSIMMWELVDQTFGIQQIRQDGQLAQIPGSKLLIFVNEREGDNWWGTSMLRAAYKHWYYKDNFYKIDAVAFERQGLGVPYFKMPVGYTESDEKNAVNALQNLRANESAYLVYPDGYEFGFADMGARTTRDPSKSIEHHNKEILQSVLAQFLELGASKGGSGSRALSQDHSDLFLKAMEAIANSVRDVVTKDLIKELVDLNFDNVKDYPVMDYSGITKVDVAALGTALGQLGTAGFLTPNNDDEQWVRAALGMPPRTDAQIQEDDDQEESSQELEMPSEIPEDVEDDTDDVDPTDTAPATVPKPAAPAVPAKPAKKGRTNAPKPAGKTQANKDKQVDDATVTKKTADGSKGKKSAHEHAAAKRFDDGSGFMTWRPIMASEQDVAWQKIQETMDKMEADFSAAAKQLLTDAKDTFMAKVHKALEAGDAKAVAELEITFVSQYKTILKSAMMDAYDFGKNKASNELGIAVPASNAQTLASIDLMAGTIASKTASDIESQAKLSAASAIQSDAPALQKAGVIDSNLDDAIDKTIARTAPTMIGQAVNNGRNDVFQRNTGMIYALQRSELLDQKTCNFCLSMDARVIEPTDDWADASIFHTNCRGIWVAIMTDEVNPPKIEGVPSELGDSYGGEVNSLVQPKAPIVKPGGLADMYLKRQADQAAANVKALGAR